MKSFPESASLARVSRSTESSCLMTLSVQRIAVQLWPHQQTTRQQVAVTEPVVLHHGRQEGVAGSNKARRPLQQLVGLPSLPRSVSFSEVPLKYGYVSA